MIRIGVRIMNKKENIEKVVFMINKKYEEMLKRKI